MLKGLFERLGLKKLNVVDLDAVDNKTAENLVVKFRDAKSILEKAKITKEFLSLSILERAKQIKSANSVDKVVPKSGEEIQSDVDNTMKDVQFMRKFMPIGEINTLVDNRDFSKISEMAKIIREMPVTYGQDGKGNSAIAYLHYFKGGSDWYITENDKESIPAQAFGLVSLNGNEEELGYISITELIQNGVELDLYYTQQTVGEIKGIDAEDRFSDNDTLNEAHRILSLGKDITLQDLEYFTETETLKINELVDVGDEKAIEVDSMLDGIISIFTVVFDSINNEDGDVELDGIKEVKIQKLLTDIFLDRKGEMDEHKKDKSLKELQALIKNNNSVRKIVEDIVSSVDNYEKDEINENYPSLFSESGL